MVKFALPFIALALTASMSVTAAPTSTSGTTFSFEQWVEDIIANPDTALTVDEALAAAQAADVVGSAGGLQKRIRCDQESIGWKRAPVRLSFLYAARVNNGWRLICLTGAGRGILRQRPCPQRPKRRQLRHWGRPVRDSDVPYWWRADCRQQIRLLRAVSKLVRPAILLSSPPPLPPLGLGNVFDTHTASPQQRRRSHWRQNL